LEAGSKGTVAVKLVLAVEDDVQEQLVIKRAVAEIAGVRLLIVDTGGDALDYVHRRGPYERRRPDEDPDVVLADHQLPDMFAFDLVRMLRGIPECNVLPIVVYAAQANGDAHRYIEFGAVGLLPKSNDEAEFKDGILAAVSGELGIS
jgi:CheY-like chemotaxis protein